MNREIKFRFWCGGEILPDYQLLSHKEHGIQTINGILDGIVRWHVMQYTGLKDKHGKEIYEGDIVTLSYDTNALGTIEWAEEHGGFSIDWGSEVVYTLDVVGLKIIGNIYENPELLND